MALQTFLTFIMLQGIVAMIVPSEGTLPIIGKHMLYSQSSTMYDSSNVDDLLHYYEN